MLGNVETQAGQVSDGLFNDILAGILMGHYLPESRLPTEQRLAHDYGVSRTVVRSALEQLKSAGIVQSRQGSGTIVTAFDPETIAGLSRDAQLPALKDCYACRLAIEPAIAAAVAQRLSSESRAFLEDQQRHLENGDAGSEYERYARDASFHIRLAKLSGNVFFISVMNMLRPHVLFAMNISKTLTRRAQKQHFNQSRQEHLTIISAILAENPEAAQAAMREHIEEGRRRIFSSDTRNSDLS